MRRGGGSPPFHVVAISTQRGGGCPSPLCCCHFNVTRRDMPLPGCVVAISMQRGGTCLFPVVSLPFQCDKEGNPLPFMSLPFQRNEEGDAPPLCVVAISTQRGETCPSLVVLLPFRCDEEGHASPQSCHCHFDVTRRGMPLPIVLLPFQDEEGHAPFSSCLLLVMSCFSYHPSLLFYRGDPAQPPIEQETKGDSIPPPPLPCRNMRCRGSSCPRKGNLRQHHPPSLTCKMKQARALFGGFKLFQ